MTSSVYIVRFKDDATPTDVSKIKKDLVDSGAEITHEYTLIKAVAVKLPDAEISTLEAHPSVAQIEKDQEVKAY
ncbi:hypothetical protein V1525DRAFT_398198 [Lipomyces kononenkoae]|uniref:Uncharacterized protein n=1 Tax=Lipomyces kononenkoae TaxID=34357 RepID=A0ACC3T690_LIPKO